MRTTVLLTLIFCIHFLQVSAQEFKIAASNQSRLVLDELNEVTLEGYDGSEVVFTVTSAHHERPERAEGLKAISGLGLEDNTGIGLSVEKTGNDINVAQLSRRANTPYKLRVPKNISISYHHSSPEGDDLSVKDFSGELEISTVHNSVDMENVTGPMTVKTVHGDIVSKFSSTIKSPVSIVSAHGDLDVSLPATTKAKVEMMSDHGEMYTDMEIAFDKSAEELRKLSSSVVKGTINGGGDITMELSSAHGNIYLRKQ
jgi:hypothetical protein